MQFSLLIISAPFDELSSKLSSDQWLELARELAGNGWNWQEHDPGTQWNWLEHGPGTGWN